MPIDYQSDVGRVRLIISDVDDTNFAFTDEQILAFLDMEGSVKAGAAAALDTIATSEALIGKVVKTQDLSTDAAKLADALRKHADKLREEDEAERGDRGFFDIVDFGRHSKPELTELGDL